MKKTIFVVTFATALALTLGACGTSSGGASPQEGSSESIAASTSAASADASAPAAPAALSETAQAIAALDGVMSVEPIDISTSQVYSDKFLVTLCNPIDWSSNGFAWPYYVGAAHEYGQYQYGFSYLREACEKAGLGDALTIKDDDIDNILFDMVLTPEQNEAFAYDGMFYEGVTKWIDTTDAKIVFIYGDSDPWYSLRMHDTSNPNVTMFVNSEKPHSVRIMDFDAATLQEMTDVVSDAIFAE